MEGGHRVTQQLSKLKNSAVAIHQAVPDALGMNFWKKNTSFERKFLDFWKKKEATNQFFFKAATKLGDRMFLLVPF